MHNSSEGNAIQQRMEEVRRDLDENVQDTVEGVRELSDWHFYMKAYPWVGLGAAFAVGYLITTWRPFRPRQDNDPQVEEEKQIRLLDVSTLPPKVKTFDLMLSLVGNLLLQGLTSYVGHQASLLFASQTSRPEEAVKSKEDNHR